MKQNFLIGSVCLLAGVAISFFYFQVIMKAEVDTMSAKIEETDLLNAYQEGFEAAKKLALESPAGKILEAQDEVRGVSGVVTLIEGNRVHIKTESQNPYEVDSLDERIVILSPQTQIYTVNEKSSELRASEMEAFVSQMSANQVVNTDSLPTMPPTPFVRTVVDISSIMEGATINILTEENIKQLKEFTANEIEIYTGVVETLTN